MERITPDRLVRLKERFGDFHDSVIHSISIGLFTDKTPSSRTIHLVIGAPDLDATPSSLSYDFVNIEFRLVGAESFALVKGWNYDLSVIFEMNISIHKDKIYFVQDTSIPDFEDFSFEESVGTASTLLFVAREAYYKISPYQIRDF